MMTPSYLMGCAISAHRRIIDSNLLHLNDNSHVELISSSLQLINYFKDKDSNLPKCLIIFGGSGSNKGEVIYEMICTSWVNYGNEQMYECQQDCQKQKLINDEQVNLHDTGSKNVSHNSKEMKIDNTINHSFIHHTDPNLNHTVTIESKEIKPKPDQHIPHINIASNTKSQILPDKSEDQIHSIDEQQANRLWSSNTQQSNQSSIISNIRNKYEDNLNFVYSYIDIERLILENLKERIKSLGECGLVGYDELFASETSLDEARGARKKTNRNRSKSSNLNVSSTDHNQIKIDEKIFVQQNDDKVNDVEIVNLIHHSDQQTNSLRSDVNDCQMNDNSLTDGQSKIDIDNQMEKVDQQKLHSSKVDKYEQDELNHPRFKNTKTEVNSLSINDNSKSNHQQQYLHSIIRSSKRASKRGIRNDYCADFLKACEEDFEFSQSKINTNYNSRELRQCMFTYANCVTNNWVFSLIEKEIEKRNQSLIERFLRLVEIHHSNVREEIDESDEFQDINEEPITEKHIEKKSMHQHNLHRMQPILDYTLPEIIYIVNLVPNQINIFRHCLFLQQTPNLNCFDINFIAINLISGDLRKKDLDSVICNTIQDELNYNYMNYFRSIDRLVDIQIRQLKQKIRIRITKSKQAIKMKSESDVQVLFGALENNQEIDLSAFKLESERKRDSKKVKVTVKKGNLLYIIDDVVDIGDILFCVEDRTLEMVTLRKFIQAYLDQKDKIAFNRTNS